MVFDVWQTNYKALQQFYLNQTKPRKNACVSECVCVREREREHLRSSRRKKGMSKKAEAEELLSNDSFTLSFSLSPNYLSLSLLSQCLNLSLELFQIRYWRNAYELIAYFSKEGRGPFLLNLRLIHISKFLERRKDFNLLKVSLAF